MSSIDARRIEEPDSLVSMSNDLDRTKLIAFYLPQFHPIPENDRAWGKGFTEWTNVSASKPLFVGHNQPRMPGELGFYDLRLSEVMRTQVALAKEYDIFGFCYYFYWFDGRRVLEKPLEMMLGDSSIDMPFCLCWANENWTRRWDGSENEVIIAQNFAPAVRTKIIDDLIPYFKDNRYIRVNGRHLLLIYRADIIPDLRETINGWREVAKTAGIDLFIAACLTFGFGDPLNYGFDAGVEFPPHGVSAPDISESIDWITPFEGKAFHFAEVVRRELIKPENPFPTFRSAMAGWDNTARRGAKGHIFVEATPEQFEVWLSALVIRARSRNRPGERFVFINAWNEWAEGAHLEPDQKFGRRWLQACARAVKAEQVALAEEMDPDFLSDLVAQSKAGGLEPLAARLLEVLLATEERLLTANAVNSALSQIYLEWLEYFSAKQLRPLIPTQEILDGAVVANNYIPGWVDSDKSRTFSIVSINEPWFISGWVCFREYTPQHSFQCVITLVEEVSGDSFSTIAIYPLSRSDIAKAYPDLPATQAGSSGFQAYVDLRTLSAGPYKVAIGLTDQNTITYIQDSVRIYVK